MKLSKNYHTKFKAFICTCTKLYIMKMFQMILNKKNVCVFLLNQSIIAQKIESEEKGIYFL